MWWLSGNFCNGWCILFRVGLLVCGMFCCVCFSSFLVWFCVCVVGVLGVIVVGGS